MTSQDLLAQLRVAFANVAQPTDTQLIYDNSGTHDECEQIKRAFAGRTWQSLDVPFMVEERNSYSCFSSEAFHYYFPAFVQLILINFDEADDLPRNLVSALTLPTEYDAVAMAGRVKNLGLDKQMPEVDFDYILRNQLHFTNQDVHNFFARYGAFSREQGRVTRRFLQYLQTEHADEFFHDEPATAIQRYWFKFTD
ncbi:hypothetical protein ACAW74_12570 [Fibrella sp. WM1]|uniref:hypothetical protein n=1 Tax=Fibrella musci TaxID=3242485 RepID=UPI00352155A6